MLKKCFFSFMLLLMMPVAQLLASGIQVSGTTVTTNDDKISAQVKFTLEWDHSWRLETAANSPSNYDAAWVFIKFRQLPGDNWQHGYISATVADHKVPTSPIAAELKVGISPAIVGGANANVGVGAFVYRKEPGNGVVTYQDIELKWNFTQNGLSGGEQVEVCVLATEMVYIPQIKFQVGDQTSVNHFRKNVDLSYVPYEITSEAALNISNCRYNYTSTNATYKAYSNLIKASLATTVVAGTQEGDIPRNLNYSGNGGYNGGYHVVLPAAFPKGFQAFFCMKYEITQGEYVQFLNKNTVTVRNSGVYYPGQTTARHAIVKKENTGTSTVPAEYELTNTGAAYLPCNFLGTKDYLAWLVWAGLRPITELEYEKVCRGIEPVPATTNLKPQYAWLAVEVNNAVGFVNKGQPNEAPANSDGNCAFGTAANVNTYLDGPMRAGGFATPTSSRIKAGATYYGVMEMSGNIKERCVTVALAAGRSYTGIHGNGEIGVGSTPELPANWPSLTTAGLGFRGGSYLDIADRARISDRNDINLSDHARKANFGGRGVRTAP